MYLNFSLPSSGKQCCVRGEERSSVPHGAGGEGPAATRALIRPSVTMVRGENIIFKVAIIGELATETLDRIK